MQRKIPLSQIDTPTNRVQNETSFSEPHRPFVLPLRSAGSEIRLVHLTDESSNSAPIELVQTNMGGVPMSRESTYSDSGLSSMPFYVRESGQYPTAYANAAATAEPKRKPQMSWFLTISLLIIVTGVSRRCQSLSKNQWAMKTPFL